MREKMLAMIYNFDQSWKPNDFLLLKSMHKTYKHAISYSYEFVTSKSKCASIIPASETTLVLFISQDEISHKGLWCS